MWKEAAELRKVIIVLMAAAVAGLAAASLMFNGSEAEDAAFSEAFTEPLHLNFSASEQVWLKDHTRLKVGVIRDMPPYEEYNENQRGRILLCRGKTRKPCGGIADHADVSDSCAVKSTFLQKENLFYRNFFVRT